MDKQRPDSYSGRFSEGNAGYRTAPRQATAARRPSGFGTAGQTSRLKPAPESEPKKTNRIKKEKAKKEKRIREERDPGKNRPLLRMLLVLITVVVLVCLLMVLIFGGEDTTYHQMPTIERESIAQFESEETPIPGMEEL